MNKAESSTQSNCAKSKICVKEWPGYKPKQPGELLENTLVPLLIMELQRLVPIYGNPHPRTHVFNMPHLKLREVELVGTIRKIYARSKLDIWIDDGTGRLQILYHYSNFEKVKEERKRIDAKFSRLQKIAEIKNLGINHMQDLEKRWKQETRNGTLGADFKILEYVHVIGYIHLDYGYYMNKRDVSIDNAALCKPTVFAKIIYHLTEQEYNEKLQTWILGTVKQRYEKHA